MANSYVTITKYWHNPRIQVLVTNEGIGLRMNIEDFKEALRREMKIHSLDAAISRIIEGIKEEASKVV